MATDKSQNHMLEAATNVLRELDTWTTTTDDGRFKIYSGHLYSLEQCIWQLLHVCYVCYTETSSRELRDVLRLILDDALKYRFEQWLFDKGHLLKQGADIHPSIMNLVDCGNLEAVGALRKALAMLGAKSAETMARQEEAAAEPNNIEAVPPLTKAQRLAYQSYEYAIGEKRELADATDNDVYDWLAEHGVEGDYKLPSRETWKRYVGAGRKYQGTHKNTARAGREGHSTIKRAQIQSLSEISSRYDTKTD